MRNEESYRQECIEIISDGEMVSAVGIEMVREGESPTFLDCPYDKDGDSIQARALKSFDISEECLIRAVFVRGMDPSVVARVLRKFADMLDGPHGYDLANLYQNIEGMDHAYRMDDENIYIFNMEETMREIYERIRSNKD